MVPTHMTTSDLVAGLESASLAEKSLRPGAGIVRAPGVQPFGHYLFDAAVHGWRD